MEKDQQTLEAAAALAAAGDCRAALTVLDRLMETPDSEQALLLKARIYGQLEQYADGAACCEAILARTPDHSEAKQCLAALMREKDRAPAKRKAVRMLRLASFLAPVLLFVALAAWLLLAAGRRATRADFSAITAEIQSMNNAQQGFIQNQVNTLKKEVESAEARRAKENKRIESAVERLETESLDALVVQLRKDIETQRNEFDRLLKEPLSKITALDSKIGSLDSKIGALAETSANELTDLRTLFGEGRDQILASHEQLASADEKNLEASHEAQRAYIKETHEAQQASIEETLAKYHKQEAAARDQILAKWFEQADAAAGSLNLLRGAQRDLRNFQEAYAASRSKRNAEKPAIEQLEKVLRTLDSAVQALADLERQSKMALVNNPDSRK